MSAPIYLNNNGHRAAIKWHRGRRRATDPVFVAERILEAMRIGASVEVDLVVHGDDGFAVLHDLTLERETTGTGKVRDAPAAVLRDLHLRGNDGEPIADKVLLMEDLCMRLVGQGMYPDALLQLDYKEDLAALTPQVIADFERNTAPIAGSLILSGGDFKAIEALAKAVPGIATGYDPCYGESLARLEVTGDYRTFIDQALATAPDANMIYLDYRIVLAAADLGIDLVAHVHADGRKVDAWTINHITPQSIVQVERLLGLKVDQITTDDPEGLAKAFSS